MHRGYDQKVSKHQLRENKKLVNIRSKKSLVLILIMAFGANVSSSAPISAATKLRSIVEDPNGFILCPGVYDGFSARIALQVGFDGLYMVCHSIRTLLELFAHYRTYAQSPRASYSIPLGRCFPTQYAIILRDRSIYDVNTHKTGAGTSASVLGHADLGLMGLPQMRTHAEMIASLTSDPITSSYPNSPVPLISDADTGYGGPIMVARTVMQYAQSGVAGLHIEDQVQTKRCGHLAGKELVDKETYESRIRAAVQARKRIGSDIVIIARTDALQSYGYDEAIARLRIAHAAGADVAFLEGITSVEQAKKAIKDLPMPCLLNMVEHGATPNISANEAREMGFKIIIFPFAALAPAYTAIKASMEKLKNEGFLGSAKEMTPQMLFRICGVEEDMKIDAEAGGKSYRGGID